MCVAKASGSVKLTVFNSNHIKRQESAVFSWRAGATRDFLNGALQSHSKTLIRSSNEEHAAPITTQTSYDNVSIEYVSVDDSMTPVTIEDILSGKVKSVKIIWKFEKDTLDMHKDPKVTDMSTVESISLDKTTKLEYKPSVKAFQHQFVDLTAWKKKMNEKKTPAVVTWSEMQKHKTPNSCWVVLHGQVYDITEYLQFHPGVSFQYMYPNIMTDTFLLLWFSHGLQILSDFSRSEILKNLGGMDITASFLKHHPWVNGPMILQNKYIGQIEKS